MRGGGLRGWGLGIVGRVQGVGLFFFFQVFSLFHAVFSSPCTFLDSPNGAVWPLHEPSGSRDLCPSLP